MSEAKLRRILFPLTVAIVLAYYLFFVWRGARFYFDNDDMMNLYLAWSKPLMESYRPLGALFYRALFAVSGFSPLPFRIVCIALGAVNIGLCYWFARLVSGSGRVCALALLLFAFHSRMMEIWYRTGVVYDLLCFTFFYLAACLYMSRPRPGILRGLLIVACFVAALEAKENAAALPVILLAWYFMFGREIGTDHGRGIEEALRNLNAERPLVAVLTSGGAVVGKTTAITNDPELKAAQLTYDSDPDSRKTSVQKIEAALAAGLRVYIVYVHRDPVDAFAGGFLPRATSVDDASETFSYLMRRYSADPNVCFQAFDNSHGPAGKRMLPLEKESAYRATLGHGPEAATEHPDGVDGGSPEAERSRADGGIDLSLWIPLTCGLVDVPYLWFKTHGANALTNIAAYESEFTFSRFAHTWALYLNYIFLRSEQILPWTAMAILALLLVAAVVTQSRKLFFAFTVLFVPVLPVAFLSFRGAFVLYTSYPGWTLYAAIALVALQDLIPVNKTALACLTFAVVGWRVGKLNLHDQRADPRHWLYDSPTQVRQMVDQMRVLEPRLPQGARCLFLQDGFSTDEWTPYFIMKLLYHDDTLTVDRVKMMDKQKPDLNSYQYVFTFENGKYRLLKP